MDNIINAKQICLERDAHRCRHCGTTENIDVYQLHKREGRLAWQLSNLTTLCDDCKRMADECDKYKGKNRVGVILCGGRGSRLYPLTKFHNKHVLPVGLTPMVMSPLKTIRKFGVKRALIVIDREGADQIIGILGSGKEFGMDISYKVQEGAGGISEALYLAKDFAQPGDEIVCILGDNIFDNEALDTHVDLQDNLDGCIFLKKVPNPEDYGVAVFGGDNGTKIKEIVEKPKDYIGNMAVVGLYIYTYRVFDIISSVEPSERGELEISSVNDILAKQGKLGSKVVSGYWADCGGSIERYTEAALHGAKQANVSSEQIDGFRAIVFDDK